MAKLFQISVTCNQGSTGKIAEQIGLLMRARGWDVYLAHGARYVNSSQLRTIQIQSKFSEYLHAFKSYLFDADGLGSKHATKRLIRQIRTIKPDIIQIHNIHGYYINYPLLFEYLNKTDIPVVMTLHDCWSFTGHCVHYVTASCDKWLYGCGACPQINSVPKSLIVDRSAQNYQKKELAFNGNRNMSIICVSRWMEQNVRRSFLKNHPIYTIHNGIDTELFCPSGTKPLHKFQVLGVSNPWSRDKGLYDVFELRKVLPYEEYEFVLVGLTPTQLKNLPLGITGLCRTNNQEELVALYSSSNVFINPTYADTFPTTNLEAMACGTPVITYRTGGSPESIDSNTGVVVDKGDIVAMANAIVAMRLNPLDSNKCRERAVELFNKNDRFKDYIALYERLVV